MYATCALAHYENMLKERETVEYYLFAVRAHHPKDGILTFTGNW